MSVLPSAVKSVAEARVSVRRLTNFFLMDEIEDSRILVSDSKQTKFSVIVKHASFHYDSVVAKRGLNDSRSQAREKAEIAQDQRDELERFSLTDINLRVKRGECIAVVGRVGSGKSTFLLSLAGQLRQRHGSTKLHGSVAYVSQTAWLLNDSLKESSLHLRLPFSS
jgi:ATP-binding cassette, subfamily C (CFTR/MRP), member 1